VGFERSSCTGDVLGTFMGKVEEKFSGEYVIVNGIFPILQPCDSSSSVGIQNNIMACPPHKVGFGGRRMDPLILN
jgi:hypothetical protein